MLVLGGLASWRFLTRPSYPARRAPVPEPPGCVRRIPADEPILWDWERQNWAPDDREGLPNGQSYG